MVFVICDIGIILPGKNNSILSIYGTLFAATISCKMITLSPKNKPIMKKTALIIFLMFFASTSLSAQEWLVDMDTAQKVATKTDRPIVLVFQGSDWCAPCIKLDREIFQSDEFKLYAKDHFVMLQADFPKKKKNALSEEMTAKNNALAERFNKRGIFPLVVVLDKNLNVLGETGYSRTSPSSYILEIDGFTK
jgi:thioredoxin-related protein